MKRPSGSKRSPKLTTVERQARLNTISEVAGWKIFQLQLRRRAEKAVVREVIELLGISPDIKAALLKALDEV